MITSLTVTNSPSSQLHIVPPLTASMFEPSDYVIHSIEGLAPPKNSMVDYDVAPDDGVDIAGIMSEPRQLTLVFGYNPNYNSDVESLRRGLYKHFPYRTLLRLEFEDTVYGQVYIEGYVETHEANIFSKEPLSQISIICPNPMFRSVKVIERNWDLGTGGNTNLSTISYEGTAPTPINIEVQVSPTSPDFTVFIAEILTTSSVKTQSFEARNFPPLSRPPSNSIITYRSCVTDRAFQYTLGNTTRHLIMHSLPDARDWLRLYPGISRFRFRSTRISTTTQSVGSLKLSYEERFSGL